MFPLTSSFIGQNISGYRLERLLGRGGTGMVFLGLRMDNPDDRVAIKILAPAYAISPEDMDALRTRFLREVDTLQKLRHPHIVPIRAYGQTFGDDETNLSYMILPYLEGGTLTQRMTRERLPLPTVARYLKDLADAVDYAHRQGIVHRDIKPANVLLNGNGAVVLSDFGIARLFDQQQSQLTASGQVIGTPEYMSPEQAAGHEVGPAADQYSMGVMAFEMAAGRVPFQGPTIIDYLKQHSMTPPPTPILLRPDLPEPAAAVIMKALAKKPDQRFASTSAFATAFAEGLEGRWVPETEPEANLTVHKFTPPKTISVTLPEEETTDGENFTPSKTIMVPSPLDENATPPKVVPGLSQAYLAQLWQDTRTRLQPVAKQLAPLTQRLGAFVAPRKRETAVVGAVIVLLFGILIWRTHQPKTTAQVVLPTYSATTPGTCGDGSNTKGGVWSISTGSTDDCSSAQGLLLTDPANSSALAEEFFNWTPHPFPLNYSVSADVSNVTNACVGFVVRVVDRQGYGMYICPNGTANINKYDATTGTPSLITSKKIATSAIYHLVGTVKGQVITLTINGQPFAATDKTHPLLTTTYVTLALDPSDTTLEASANFSNFVYTGMP